MLTPYLFSFLVLVSYMYVKLMSAKRQTLSLQNFVSVSLTAWSFIRTQEGTMSQNRLLSISKRARLPFLETVNYLFASKTAMDLYNLQFLPGPF